MPLSDMNCLIISPLANVEHVLKTRNIDFLISILSPRDRSHWPIVPNCTTLRLDFDDVGYSSDFGRAANPDDITRLIKFSSDWNGRGNMLIHCRAGTSRSPAAGLIALSSIVGIDFEDAANAFLDLKSYFRPNSRMLQVADQISGSRIYSNISKKFNFPSRDDELGPSILSLKSFMR